MKVILILSILIGIVVAAIMYIVVVNLFLHSLPIDEPDYFQEELKPVESVATLPTIEDKPVKEPVSVPKRVEKVEKVEEAQKVVSVEQKPSQEVQIKTETLNSFEKAVNQERTDRGLAPLVVSSCLREVAKKRAKEIQTAGVASHTRPDGTRFSFGTMCDFGVRGENLAYKVPLDTVVDRWIESPKHNDVMFRKYWAYFAVSVVGDTVAMEFGK